MAKETRGLELTRIKIQHGATDLDFLKICRDSNILPKFAIINHRTRNCRNNWAFDRLGFAIIRGEIRRTHNALDSLFDKALNFTSNFLTFSEMTCRLSLTHVQLSKLRRKATPSGKDKTTSLKKLSKKHAGEVW